MCSRQTGRCTHISRPLLPETVPPQQSSPSGWHRNLAPRHAHLAEVIHPSEPVSGVGREQGSREQGCWTPHPPRWRLDGPTLPKLPEGLVSHEHRPGSPRVREEAAAPRILGGPGSCVPVGTLKGLVCWSLHAKGTRGARRRAGGLPAGLVWGPPGHRARSPRAGCLLPGARVTPGQGWDGGNRSGDTPRP